jgi:hypothetical protein
MRASTLLATVAAIGFSAAAQAQSPTFTTIDNPGDPTFNQLLGINNSGVISGYFGSGNPGQPNQAYTIAPPYTTFANANEPGSVQTQATGITTGNTIVGFWAPSNLGIGIDPNYGFIRWNTKGKFRYLEVTDPNAVGTPSTTQVLGMNPKQIAAGFYLDVNGVSHGFTFDVATGAFTPVTIGGSMGDSANGINKNNLLCGSYMDAQGVTHAFLKPLKGGVSVRFTVPGALITQFLGVASDGEAVGFYQLTMNDITHGLVYNPANGQWQTLDNPNGVGGTVLNGINDKHQIVGFYTDAAGNVDGMLVNNAP